MIHKPNPRKAAAVAVGVSAVLLVGTAVSYEYASASNGTSVTQAAENPAVPSYPRNAGGLSYGSELDATTPDQVPDLIEAIATNGREGYVRRSDIYPQLPTSPGDALKQLQSAGAANARTIPVYAQDGKTVVGAFEITPANGDH